MNAAFGIAISNYVAQNYDAGLWDRIRKGTAACLLQTSIANALMCVMIIFGRHLVVPMFVTQPTAEIIWYSDDRSAFLPASWSAADLSFCHPEYGQQLDTLYSLYH